MKKLLLLTQVIVLFSCSPRIKTFVENQNQKQKLDPNSKIYVIALNEELKITAKKIANLEIGETGFTSKCDYEDVIKQAKLKAKEFGANVVKVTKHKYPEGIRSGCHKIDVDLFFTENITELEKNHPQNQQKNESWEYSLLYIYRMHGYGNETSFDLYLDNKKLHTIPNSFKTIVKIPKEVIQKLTAKTSNYQTELSINFENGNEYFLECEVTLEPMLNAPRLKLKDYQIGKHIFNNFIAKTIY